MIDWKKEIEALEGWTYGDNPAMADALAEQTAAGQNLANCFLFTKTGMVPVVGDRSYIKNSQGQPVCVVEVVEVKTLPFAEVGDDFARAEGYATLAEWQDIHRRFFSRQNPAFAEQTLVVCQRFRLLHVFAR